MGREKLGLEEPKRRGRELRRKVRPSSTGRRKVRRPVLYGRGIAHAGDDDLEEREEERFRGEGSGGREEGREEDFLWRGTGTDPVVPCGAGDGGTCLCGKVMEREEQNGRRAREVRVRGGGA